VDCLSLFESSARVTSRGGSFSGDPEGYGEEGSEDGHHSPWGPRWGVCRGSSAGDLRKLWRRDPVKNHGGSVHREL
jgi:hypothetical protein